MFNFFLSRNQYLTFAIEMINLLRKNYPKQLLLISCIQIATGVLPLLTTWVTKLVFDLLEKRYQGSLQNNFYSGLVLLLMGQIILDILQDITGIVNNYFDNEIRRNLSIHVDSLIFNKLNSFVGISYFEDSKFHETLQLGMRGARQGPIRVINGVVGLLRSGLVLFGFLGFLAYYQPLLASVVCIATIPVFIPRFEVANLRFGIARDNNINERRALYYGSLLSSIFSAKEIRIFNTGEYFLGKWLSKFSEINMAERKREKNEARITLRIKVLSKLISGAAFIWVVSEAFSSRISLGDIMLYTGAVSGVQLSISSIIHILAETKENQLFYAKFREILKLPQNVQVKNEYQFVPTLRIGIEFQNVSFRYTESHPWVIKDLNLLIPAQKCVAIVGLNGAGKTTLVKLLTRLYDPTHGAILWDGIDIREFSPTELRKKMGVIFQDFMHYDLTVQENIGLGNTDNIDNMFIIQEAARKAELQHVIDKLPSKYDTVLSRWLAESGNGVELSGGEWQKIALARVFMRNSELLILDEPSNALDAQAEYELYKQFFTERAQRTSIIISHRFSTVQIANYTAVLDGGKITEFGSHNELIAAGNLYAKLYSTYAQNFRTDKFEIE